MTEIIETDVVIVGAGPVGLFSVFACGMLGFRTHVVDSLEAVGGQCSALYPEKPIFDVPAFPSITAQDLIDRLQQQAQPFHPVFHLNQKVMGVQPLSLGGWLLHTSESKTLKAKAIIIAAGAGAFGPNRPPLEGIEAFEGESVLYHIRQKDALQGKRVVIAGGGDSAVDWAILLCDIASRVQVVHRRAGFRAAPESLSHLKDLVDKGRIDLIVPYQLNGLEGTGKQLNTVIVTNFEGEKKRLEADVLLPFFGFSYDLGPLATWGLCVEEKHLLVNPGTCETNLPGIYAVGDIARYPHKRKLILTGFAEAAQAAQGIRTQLFPGQSFHFEYSTTSGIPALTV